MPPRTPKACRVRGCRSTTTDPSGYCESHKSEGWKQYKPGQSRHQRGYGSKWDSIRARVLKRDKGLWLMNITSMPPMRFIPQCLPGWGRDVSH